MSRRHSRQIVSLLLLVVLASGACGPRVDKGAAEEESSGPLRLASWGGSFQETLDAEVIQPIASELGIDATVDAYSGEYDRLAATIRDGSNPFDLVHVETIFLEQGEREDLILPIDYAVVDREQFVAGATHSHGVAVLAWALVLSWNSSRLPDGAPDPSSWDDFFSLERYPGPRCVRKVPEGTIEMALLADGVAPGDLYQGGLDIERALAKLETIRPSITWWSSGAELEQKLVAGCSLAAAWNGRVLNLRHTADQPVDLTYEGAIHQYDWWVVPRNTPRRDAVFAFLDHFGSGVGQLAIGRQFGYGPVSRKIVEGLPDDLLATMPSSAGNVARGVAFNAEWWADHQAEVQDRWNRWLLDE